MYVKVVIKGDVSKWVQTQLIKKGYTLKLDGDFGPKTNSAVVFFQKANNHKTVGVASVLTRGKLKM